MAINDMTKHIGYIGLGKMGTSMVARLNRKGWHVETYDVNGKGSAQSLEQLANSLSKPRIIWIMVPAGKPVDAVLKELLPYLAKGDVVIDGGNSFYEDSISRAKKLNQKGIAFLDVGVSGGPGTVRAGKPALMIGGERKVFEKLKPLFQNLTREKSFGYIGKSGAGHFVKMLHNGIEYGMMQALAEGFSIMEKAPFALDLRQVARVYNNGSVIQSRLTGWLEGGFAKYGRHLREASGSVQHTGEGEWTVKTAKKLGVSVPAIKAAFDFRVQSAKKPSYTGKILMMLRHMFGGHPIK
jgi:6-phosphogluconate dehydrogenase